MRRALLPSILVLSAVGAQAQSLKPSFQEQLKLGLQAAADLRKKEKVLPATDSRVKKLREMGSALIKLIPVDELKKRPYQFSFDVIESKDVNAFCLPGGPVFFYTGLLDKLTTEDQVYGVLGHEITHARNEHWARGTEDQLKKQLGMQILLGLLKANDVWYKATGAALTLDMLKYSRKYETEADNGGFDLTLKQGYNPQGMIDVFTLLSKLATTSKLERILGTTDHPGDGARIKHLQDLMTKSKVVFPAQRSFKWSS